MRVDVVTIFPEYLAPLDLSLIGRARTEGLLDVRVHDLREYTHDRHRTVDDTPYGGGAGMVMRPEPWGEALDALIGAGPLGAECDSAAEADGAAKADGAAEADTKGAAGPLLVVPGPGGERFSQSMAYDFAAEPWVAFACGRYEGIDERVYEHARERLGDGRVRIVSLGDYVLNGGEVAVLAMVEAIARLLPGVIGNEASLDEESHTGGLLEYPVYTKPASWRGREVPEVLRSGDHGRIASWRHEQRLERTAQRRPDLLHSSALLSGRDQLPVTSAVPADAAEIFTLMRACWSDEARLNQDWDIPPMLEELAQVQASVEASDWRTWVVRDPGSGRLAGSVRGRLVCGPGDGDGTPRTWEVGRLMVAPDLAGRGLGRALLAHVLNQADPMAERAWLVTGAASVRNQRMYKKAGFRLRKESTWPGTVEMDMPLKRRRRTSAG